MPYPPGFRHLPGYFSQVNQQTLLAAITAAIAAAPLFVPKMPRTGTPMSVRMTNCGPLGWVTDQQRGYRYQPTHPETGKPWPPMPELLLRLWEAIADCPNPPQACLVNWYGEGARMGGHQDRDEMDFTAPVVSVSLGDEAAFFIGGTSRAGPKQRLRLKSGDVCVIGGGLAGLRVAIGAPGAVGSGEGDASAAPAAEARSAPIAQIAANHRQRMSNAPVPGRLWNRP